MPMEHAAQEVTGFGNRVLGAVDKVAPVAGAFVGWTSELFADGRGIKDAPAHLINMLKGFKIANPLITTEIALQLGDEHFPIASGVTTGIIGLMAQIGGDAIGGRTGSMIGKIGSAAKKFGFSTAINAGVASYIYLARLNPHGYSASETKGMTPTGSQVATIDVDNSNRGSARSFTPGTATYGFAA